MASLQAMQGTKAATMSITVVRADGRTEDLGVVCEYHHNPLRRLYFALRRYAGLPITEQDVFGPSLPEEHEQWQTSSP